MSSTRSTQIAVCLGLILAVAAPEADAAAAEKRCTDLGSDCICSEPMNVNDGTLSPSGWNPSDSPSSTECRSRFMESSCSSGSLTTTRIDDLDYGGSNPPGFAFRSTGTECFTWLVGEDGAPGADQRLCSRFYVRVDNNFVGAGQKNGGCPREDFKMWDMCNGHPNCSQMTENTGSGCGSAGNYHRWVLNVDSLSIENNYFLTSPDNFSWEGCRKDASGNGGWCRVEICASGDLDGNGSKQYQAKVTALDSGRVAQATSTAASGAPLDQFHFNFDLEGNAPAGYEVAYYMEASWPSNSGQFIGPAAEIEGSGGGGGGTPAAVCGNGLQESGEQCDDGNTASGDGCSSTCVIESAPAPACGDGNLDSGEQCDDGNTSSGDGCSSTCVVESASPPPATGVLFSDDFEGSLASIRSSWGNSTPGNISLVSDVPPGSPGSQAIRLDAAAGGTGYLFHQLPQNHDELYFRYYVKYEGGTYHHAGGMIGGYDPPTSYPQGDAGLKGVRPNGDRLLNFSYEALTNLPTDHMDTYVNWIDMQGADFQGQYYGRLFLEDLDIPHYDQWTCVEMRLKMNTPAGQKNGEWQLWVDGNEVANMVPGSPAGYWDSAGNWHFDAGSPGFQGFQWRDTSSLGLNWVKVQNFDATGRVWVDDVVVSTERVGCNGQAAPPPPPPPPPTGGGGSALTLSTTASVVGSDATITATVANGIGPYHYLFDCTDDGNWDSPILAPTNQTSVQHACSYGTAGTFSVRTQAWDEGTGDVLQDLRSVTTTSSGTSSAIGQPGKPVLVP